MAHTSVVPGTPDEGSCGRHPLSRRAFAGLSAAAVAGLAAAPAKAEASALRDLGAYMQELLKSAEGPESAPTAPAAAPSGRPSLLQSIADRAYNPVSPAVEPYTVADDFSNVINMDAFYLNDAQLDCLRRNGFLIMRETGREFFEVFEQNRYNLVPNFVTVDAMTHTYHLYFAFLLRNTERGYLSQMVRNLAGLLLQASEAQLEVLRGTEWEQAARRNAGFFAVASQLMGADDPVPPEVQEQVQAELDLVMGAGGIAASPLFGGDEDYSQYAPRGYYEGNPDLEAYFRAMMWYGRRNFTQKDEGLDRGALLITLALAQNPEALDLWSAVYTVTSFFSGASDDNGYYEYRALLDEAYGGVPQTADLAANTAAWDVFHRLTAELPAPRINSIPVVDVGTEVDHLDEGKGFRVMGQRFSLDESIFTQLTYNRVAENPAGDKRLLPNGLDVPAAFGSDAALSLLEGLGVTAYAGYPEQMEALRAQVADAPANTWLASLYSQWLLMLRPLALARGEGYPPFMQGDAWARKDLQSFLGSFAELKHDTILYAKQMMAEGGGAGVEARDDRGYVEPEPEVFARLASLVEATAAGLTGYGLLGETDAQNLGILQELATRLEAIARKELANELPTDDEFELIRSFGVQIEHFWQEVHKDEVPEGEYLTTFEFPSAIVADVASDPNGQVLEVGTGEVSTIYAVVPVEGSLRLASGSVYSYYEFPWPLGDRLTDAAWLRLLGMDNMDSETFGRPQVAPVSWTDDFSLCWRDFY